MLIEESKNMDKNKELFNLFNEYKKKFGECYTGVRFNRRFNTIDETIADIKWHIDNNQPQEDFEYEDNVDY